jgi:hypothetical protein
VQVTIRIVASDGRAEFVYAVLDLLAREQDLLDIVMHRVLRHSRDMSLLGGL